MNEESYITIVDRASSHKIDVLFQEEVQLDINVPLFYIKSGEEEVKHYVEKICKPAVAEFVENQKNNTIKHIDEYTNNTAIKTIELYTDEKTAVIADYATEAENSAQISAKNASDALSYAEISAEQATIAQNNNKEIENIIDKQSFKYKITNCITEIPQDIKLELNDGTLTLKAGSKVYIPKGKDSSGNNIFSEYITSSDLSFGASSLGSTKRFVSYTNNSIIAGSWESFTSGTTVPSSGYYYHSEENKIYRDGAVVNDMSLPLMFGDYVTQSGFSSIDQVFNGFGYIGSTVFALPGVKGLIPNGRNEDGSLRNIEFTVGEVLTQTRNISGTNAPLVLKGNSFANYGVADYNEELNLNISSTGTNIGRAIVGTWSANSSGVITSLSPKLPFRAVDYSDKPEISSWGMPSDRYIDLTLGASGSSYTAPANGWYTISKQGTSGQFAAFENTTAGGVTWITTLSSATDCRISCPAKKGDNVRLWYGATGATHFFRFVYAEGEN